MNCYFRLTRVIYLKYRLAFEVEVSWDAQNTQADAGSLIVREATDDNLIVSSATADISATDYPTYYTGHRN